jgi:ATP-dependent DNA ligase
MLCYPFEEKRLKTWPAAIVQPKLDGDRCRAIFDGSGNVTLLTSEENEVQSVPHIKRALEALHLTHVELDGELYTHGMLHQDIRSIVGRTKTLSMDYGEMQYHVFDIVNQGFQLERLKLVQSMMMQAGPEIEVVPFELAHNVEQIMQLMADYNEMGYEGVIVRHPFGQYVRKRSTQIMKFKPRKEDFYTIVGSVEEISIHGEPKNALGALICQDDMGTSFQVGSGPALTREGRIALWAERSALPGKVAHIKYQHLSKDHVPRFPVLVEVISPKDVGLANTNDW